MAEAPTPAPFFIKGERVHRRGSVFYGHALMEDYVRVGAPLPVIVSQVAVQRGRLRSRPPGAPVVQPPEETLAPKIHVFGQAFQAAKTRRIWSNVAFTREPVQEEQTFIAITIVSPAADRALFRRPWRGQTTFLRNKPPQDFIAGVLEKSFDATTLAGSGIVETPTFGTLAQTLAALTVTASGGISLAGSLSKTLDPASLLADGVVATASRLPAYVVAHAGDAHQVVPYLVELMTASPFRWTTFGRPLFALTHLWTNYPVDVQGLSSQSYDITDCTITIGDATDVIAAADLLLAKGLTGTIVNIYECWLEPTEFTVQATVQAFKGRIQTVDLTESIATLKCGSYALFGAKVLPRWIVSGNCAFRFKDSRCGYTGAATSCDHTWTDCGTKSNQARFGGFRNLPKSGMKLYIGKNEWRIE